ncbi:hypothetical protein [Accumulibacter sp.]|uniref:pilus assembly PilX family protein n=1 Tax=Accumulibacter sp. TaxID=2053492 RepID=UPI0025FDB67D|nr:hypothetical protein [Accumulibacter sp.]MCM8594786.1 hypothetical protein [Accumulibacter sp.]MCM8625109.1 hypothetical protein [Accumulibacter sp.]MDS4048931.1 hypothetical protein [Accumulibacter sp.]
MLLKSCPVPRVGVARSQRGVVLLVALIILVALTLAGIAVMRSVDTANVVAGNLSFHQSAIHSGERSTELAVTNFLLPNNVVGNTTLHQNWPGPVAAWYIANGLTLASPAATGAASWDAFWNAQLAAGRVPVTIAADAAGNTVQYFVHRLCQNAGAPYLANCTKAPASLNVGGSQSAGGVPPLANNQVYYRITTRIAGPRRTVAYIQTIVAL